LPCLASPAPNCSLKEIIDLFREMGQIARAAFYYGVIKNN
jgi:hypothetical protein